MDRYWGLVERSKVFATGCDRWGTGGGRLSGTAVYYGGASIVKHIYTLLSYISPRRHPVYLYKLYGLLLSNPHESKAALI